MLLSVIIPNYCHAPFLKQRIESVLRQSFSDFELILLDDASTDSSRDILEEYRNNPHVAQIVCNECNTGSTFRQWQKGFELARGRYIWIAESDDFAEPDFAASCLKYLENDPNCMLAFTDSNFVDEEGRFVRRKHKPVKAEATCCGGRNFVCRYMLDRNYIFNASMVVFRRDAIPATDSYTRYKYCGDWLFWALVAASNPHGKVVHIHRSLNNFRQHDRKVTPTAERCGLGLREGLPVLQEIFKAADIPQGLRFSTLGHYYRRIDRKIRADETLYKKIKKEWQATFPHPAFYKFWRGLYRLTGVLRLKTTTTL